MPAVTTEDLVCILDAINSRSLTLHTFLLAIFDTQERNETIDNAVNTFHSRKCLKAFILHLNDKIPKRYRKWLIEAAVEVSTGHLKKELDDLSEVNELRLPANTISEASVKNFSLAMITKKMQESAPMLLQLLRGLATANEKKVELAESIVPTVGSILLYLRSRNSNCLQAMIGLFLHGTSTQRKVIDVLSHAGLSVSSSSIFRMLEELTNDAQRRVRKAVKEKAWFLVYDNINLAKRKHDQRIHNRDAFENGATATVIINERLGVLKPLKPAYQKLTFKDLIPNQDNENHLRNVSRFHLIDVLRRHYEQFKSCSNDPPEKNVLPQEKTKMHPLAAMPIDQSTVDGNLQILVNIVKDQLQLKPEWFDTAIKEAIMSSWLVNTSGKVGGWKPTDQHQEHNNNDIKSFHAAKGTNASWTTLAKSASANIQVIADIASLMESEYKTPNNNNWHSTVSAEEDIKFILKSLDESCVLSSSPRPEGLEDSNPVDNIFRKGFAKLLNGGVKTFIQKNGCAETEDTMDGEEGSDTELL
ncbi:hypothetical protein BGZ65_005623 [Modicella reniformis]|uniref:DUF6589 domain-containing protein n=1 Tax=Modicella reniformis TaxID=1440133 RepID=A0A9P6IKX8_9FUNG|nr:hypothetical protein BGZ65_005623 [Modicella reniformis]